MPLDSERSFTYNGAMVQKTTEDKLKSRVRDIAKFYKESGRMPSFSEIAEITGLQSKNAVSKLVARLVDLKVLDKDEKGRLLPASLASPLRLLGTVGAGFPSPAEEELVDTLSLDELLIQNREATFLLKVSGDSMSGAGILPGDMVIVDKGQPPKSGDIVIAQVDGQWTMKYLRKRGDDRPASAGESESTNPSSRKQELTDRRRGDGGGEEVPVGQGRRPVGKSSIDFGQFWVAKSRVRVRLFTVKWRNYMNRVRQ